MCDLGYKDEEKLLNLCWRSVVVFAFVIALPCLTLPYFDINMHVGGKKDKAKVRGVNFHDTGEY